MTEMNEKTKSPQKLATYRFSITEVIQVFAYLFMLIATTLSAAIIILLRVLHMEKNLVVYGLVASAWMLALVVLYGAKLWWFGLARFLNATHQIRQAPRQALRGTLVFMLPAIFLVVCNVVVFWHMANLVAILEDLVFMCLLFGGNAAFTIFVNYQMYRKKFPQRTVSFLEYCNTEIKAKETA